MSETDIEIAKKSLNKAIEYANTINTNYPDRVSDARNVVDSLTREIADLEAKLKEESDTKKTTTSTSVTTKKNSTDDNGWEILKQSSTPPLDLSGNNKFHDWENDSW